MASGTVAYTDTTGNKDYLGMIANQIGRRLREASDMASDERAFAEEQAEKGGTSLSEAGIGKGYFFKRALGSRFGGDRIARTKGRLGIGGAGTNPTGDFKSRFRGGFDYNVTNEIQTATMPLTGALVSGLRGVESGLVAISQSLNALSVGMGNLAEAQEDVARQTIRNGAFMQAFLNHMQREGARSRARGEERSLERRGRGGFSGGFGGGGGGGRGMINVTPPSTSIGAGRDIAGALGSFGTSQLLGESTKTQKYIGKGVKATKNLITNKVVKKTGEKIAKNTAGTATRQISKRLASGSGKITTGLGKILGKNTDDLLRTIASGGVTKIKGFLKPAKKVFGLLPAAGKTTASLAKSAKNVFSTVDLSDVFFKQAGKGTKNLSAFDNMLNTLNPDEFMKRAEGLEDALRHAGGNVGLARQQVELAYGTIDNMEDAVSAMADLKNLGVPHKNADEFLKGMMDPKLYDEYAKAAYKPLKTAVKSGFTHKMLKAPAIKATTKATAKAGTRSLLKQIPVVAGIAGIAFGIERALKGDLLGAGLEITSGLLGATGTTPGIGLAIDGFLLGRDLGAIPMMANGGVHSGLLSAATPVIAGEKGKEAFLPLEGAEGEIAGSVFGEASAEGIVNFFAKRTNKGALPKSLLDAYPNLDPTKARDYMKLKRLMREAAELAYSYERTNDPNEMSNRLNNNSAQTSMGNLFMPTTIVNNNYSTVAGGSGGSSDDSGGNSSFPETLKNYVLGFSLFSK